ncbi:hypothetical protein [Actinotalea sp.]|uniref:hypothetical protein n=1 Tax=Actinotalea sp. TaxID=1872145 RepID=UPI003563C3A4
MAFLLPAGIALLAGLDAALLLLGVPAPLTLDRLPEVHGALLVLGFVGTVIALERAVALAAPAGFLAPAAFGLGALALLSPAPMAVGQGLFVLGALAQVGVYRALWRRQESEALALQVLGAVLALGSALLWWAGVPVATVLPWFAGFLVLTIAGERLELARVGSLTAGTERGVLALGTTVLAAVAAATLWSEVGHPLLGLALLALVTRLLVIDVARRLVRSTGLPRYMAWCLLAGYAWLLVAGGIWLLVGFVPDGPGYDAVVHAVFLGFTLSMIMAHAPVILPAVLGTPLPYSPAFGVPVVLLHVSLLLRVAGGDLWGATWALQVGGALNVVAVLTFVVLAARAGIVGARRAAGRRRARAGAVTPLPTPDPEGAR